MNNVNILNIEIDKINYDQAISKIENFVNDKNQHYIVTPNPEIILKTLHDFEYRMILNNADIKTPDGFGILLGSWFLGDPIFHRVTGIDLSQKILKLSQKNNYKVFFLGGKNDTAEIAKTKLLLKFKNLQIVGAAEGFKNIQNISEKENDDIIKMISDSGAQILFVCFGAPFQEKWIYKNLKKMPCVKVALGVGGTIDFLAGTLPRAPKIFRKLGLEWTWRLIMEPGRANRIINAVFVYSANLFKWKLHLQKPFRKNVVGIILNNKNEILAINNIYDNNHWQFPQGGIEDNETMEKSILREIEEETGLTKLKILGRAKKIDTYYLPLYMKNKLDRKKYCGKKQIIFFLKQTENETPKMPENYHSHYKWIKKDEITKIISPIRKHLTEIVLEEIDSYIK